MYKTTTLVKSQALTLLLFLMTGITRLHAQAAPSITSQPSGSTVCAGANTSFTITASDATSYQWQVNTGSGFTNVSNTGVYTGATTTTLSITSATSAMNGYTYQCIATGAVSPAATSNAALLTVYATNSWTGGFDATWNNVNNWSAGCLPASATDVTIPSSGNQPVVNITTAICKDLTINSGATLGFTGSSILEIKGNVTNSGTITATTGTIKISGTSAQNIPGIAYNNLTLSGNGYKTLTASASISGTLTLTTGFLKLNTYNFTFTGTTSTATAVNGYSPASFIVASGTGQVKIQNIGPGGRTGAVIFPIGTTASSYTPVKITNTGTMDDFGARVINNVYTSYTAADIPNGPQQNTYNVGKTWLITEATAGGSNATLNFGWASTDEQPGFNDGACWPAHWFGGRWHSPPTMGITANGVDPYDIDLTNVTSFSPFAVGSQFSITPLNLISFTGKANEGHNDLTWVTADEKAFTGFEIERSADGRSYQRIGNVPARANNSPVQTTYNYTDATAAAGAWYYRLKMVDNDGTFKYSTVVQITNATGRQAVYSLQPNVVKGNALNLVSTLADGQDVQVRIVDAMGRVWHKETIKAGVMNAGKVSITTPAMPSGIYYLQVRAIKTGAVQILKFSKDPS